MIDKLTNLFKKPKPEIRIDTPYGPTTEWARHQAAINLRNDADLREKVIAVLAKELGSITKAEMEFRRRYPECGLESIKGDSL